jgi:hypothetical protein
MLLGLAAVVAVVRWPAVGGTMTPLVAVHAGLLVGFSVCVAGLARWERSRWVQYARPLATVVVVFTLYASLGKLGMTAVPYLADAGLSQADTWLLGFNPTLAIQPYQTPGRVEFFSFVYGAFIPYIYLSLFLGCLGRPPHQRDQFLTGWVFTYTLSYLGYLFVPAFGPLVYHAHDYDTALAGGFFYRMVVAGVDAGGGPHGAFPSLHVGASVYLCLFDLRTNRLRGLTYLPIVLLIYVATVFLRYHYVVDLIAGTTIAVACLALSRGAFSNWVRSRVAAGRPALPGGEADDLPAL